ncbi:MAG: DUF4290 domain-containing protein [Crocinitomicaceae bacterium]|nr:DUF4290 domain-containing protein [Crocinitomicaceae bacterium]
MEYNTSRGKMLLPEYGRNVQNMIMHAHEIEDREERNRAAQAIIVVMGQLNPHLRDVDDYRHKLWTHLFIMSDFRLDVDSPYEKPEREVLAERPDIMSYPKGKIRFGHYGQYTQKILELSKGMEDVGERKYMTNSMGNFMKKQYLVHNNTAVENQVIADQLNELSQSELTIENPEDLMGTNQALKLLGIQSNTSSSSSSSSNHRNQKNQRHNNNKNKKQFKRRR